MGELLGKVVETFSEHFSDLSDPEMKLRRVENWLGRFNNRFRKIQKLGVDELAFNLSEMDSVWVTSSWLRIGRNLYKLAQLLGIEPPRWDVVNGGYPKIIDAFSRAVDQQGTAVRQLQSFINEQSITIREQQQAITALQFRYVLEMLAGGGAAPPRGQATLRWKRFWEQAVTKAYKKHISAPGQTTSPLASLLEDSFKKAYKKKDSPDKYNEAEQIEWLLKETDISQRAKALYGTLSQVIHSYSSDKFMVDARTYSPGDVQLLESLRPDSNNVTDGTVAWTDELQRYL